MTLLQLKYIVKIVECGSMNEASHALYVSQPALSSSVKELENELGIEIFTRSSQGIALTVDGRGIPDLRPPSARPGRPARRAL